MCGIAGIWNFDGKPVTEDEIIKFTDALQHRGPDGRGIWRNQQSNLAFGHRRLAIIDLSHAADQPLHDERYHIVFNGEIFNFIEIRNELKLKGYVFKTDSDTEVILKAYHEWKEQMLLKFNGMWALAIYDESSQECFIARDRFGIKPFLYILNRRQLPLLLNKKHF
jgi:asparagine synthase (glutamine-hydrolysing)